MSKRFVVLLENPTEAQNKSFYDFIVATNSFSWWHWMTDSWLLVTSDQSQTVTTIRDQLVKSCPNVRSLVLEVLAANPYSWAGYGPRDPESNFGKWLDETWLKG